MFSLKSTNFPKIKNHYQFIINWLQSNWHLLFICSLAIYLVIKKNISIQIHLNNDATHANRAPHTPPPLKAAFSTKKQATNSHLKQQEAYIKRFAKVAQNEMHQFGIPASITLAQGLLESQAGKSPLATKNKNHFGIKCFSKNCQKGHCSNFTDDSHKDFFRIYATAWDSFRAHSQFLQNKRYAHLIGEQDYRIWAKGLARAGYATDKQYANKLIRLIESLELERYDL
jgi:flagellum-specific peptidoglycan hydrolase FlgJ